MKTHARQSQKRPEPADKPQAGFTFRGKATLEFLADWYPPECSPCTTPMILDALRAFLAASEGGPSDAPNAAAVADKSRERSAERLAISCAVAVALGLKVKRARLRTVVRKEKYAAPLARPLRSGDDYEFVPVGAEGMTAAEVEWRQALAFRAADFVIPLLSRTRVLHDLDFDTSFGRDFNFHTSSDCWRFEYLRSAAQCDLWWLAVLLKPAVLTSRERLQAGSRLAAGSIEALVKKTIGDQGRRDLTLRTWRSRNAFGLSAVPTTQVPLSEPLRRSPHVAPLTWPMVANDWVN